jgi:hypothetical protein
MIAAFDVSPGHHINRLEIPHKMTEKAIDLCLVHIFPMGLHTMESDKPENPVAMSLFSEISAVGTMMVSQYLRT